MSNSERRIYVACLASYNNGALHGVWIDCDGKDADDIQNEVNAMLRESRYPNVTVDCPDCELARRAQGHIDGRSPAGFCGACSCDTCKGTGQVPSAEEWAIHDHEGFGDLIGESTGFERVAELAEILEEHGEEFIAYAGHVGEHYATEEGFEEAYRGTWDSEEAYAESLIDDGVLGDIPDALVNYVDTGKFARDLFLYDYWRDDSTGAVFDRNA